MAPAMPCKRDKQQSSIVKTNVEQKNGHEKEFTTMYVWKLESTSLRDREQNLCNPKHMMIALLGMDSLLWHIIIWCINLIPMPQAMKIPDGKAAVDNGMEKARDISSMGFGKKVKSKKEVILEAQRDKHRVHFASLIPQKMES